jgi:hypothetical protein
MRANIGKTAGMKGVSKGQTVADWTTDFVPIVADQDKAIIGGVVATWGPGADLDLIHHCEHHLRKNATDALDRDKLTPGDDIQRLFRDALTSEAGWDAFEAAVIERPGLRFIRPWVDRWGTKLRVQVARRADRPPVYANGAAESALTYVRNLMEPQMYSYKNRARTNRMLELVRLSMLRADDSASYTAAIRAQLISHHGHLQRGYRNVYDKRGADPFESKYSLWSTAKQKTMAETKRRRAAHRAMMAERAAADAPA